MVEKQLGILDLVNSSNGENSEKEPINWINKKDLAPGMVFKGTVENAGVKVDKFNYQGKEVEVTNGFVILRNEEGLTGLKFPWSTFRTIAQNVMPGDEVEIKYVGTVSQLQIINPELYAALSELGVNESMRLFEAIVKSNDADAEAVETEAEIQGD